ncbi:MAG TPA: hypothetical protein VMF64_13550 [Steroidobacteraceae bacterium]|jgi:hypothetical protein|nr:hypothetical protein [Steroidobacteraceae bacterium]
MFTEELARHLIRLYLSWLLTAISIALASIMIVLALVSWLLNLDELYQASQHALLLLLPVAAYQLGKGASA